MLHLLYALLATARSSLKTQRELSLENLALRQQLVVLRRSTKRPRLTKADRAFWVALLGLWADWREALVIVKPETVIGWHRKGFKLYWTWKSRNEGGRPRIDVEIRRLIQQMANSNPTWGRLVFTGSCSSSASTSASPRCRGTCRGGASRHRRAGARSC